MVSKLVVTSLQVGNIWCYNPLIRPPLILTNPTTGHPSTPLPPKNHHGEMLFRKKLAFANGKDLGASDQEWDSGASRRAQKCGAKSPSLGDNKSIYLPPFCKGKNHLQNCGFLRGYVDRRASEIWGNRVPVGRKKVHAMLCRCIWLKIFVKWRL